MQAINVFIRSSNKEAYLQLSSIIKSNGFNVVECEDNAALILNVRCLYSVTSSCMKLDIEIDIEDVQKRKYDLWKGGTSSVFTIEERAPISEGDTLLRHQPVVSEDNPSKNKLIQLYFSHHNVQLEIAHMLENTLSQLFDVGGAAHEVYFCPTIAERENHYLIEVLDAIKDTRDIRVVKKEQFIVAQLRYLKNSTQLIRQLLPRLYAHRPEHPFNAEIINEYKIYVE